jgi:TolB-like protein
MRAGYSGVRRVNEAPGIDSERVVVTTFDNLSRDSSLDYIGPMIAEWVTEGLARTGVVTVARHSFELWTESTRAPVQRTDSRRVRAARFADARLVLHGSYWRTGDSLRIDAVLADGATGRVIQAIDPVTGKVGDAMPVIDRLRQRIMSVMAARVNPELEHWIGSAGQPTSFEAYREYTEGMAAFSDQRWREAQAHFLKSAADDSNYVLPLLWAAFAFENDDQDARGDSLVRALEPRRATMAAMDRALHDYLKASTPLTTYETAARLVELAPGSEFRWKLSRAAWGLNRPREALRLLQDWDAEPSWARAMDYWADLMELNYVFGNYEASREANNRDAAVHGWGTWQLAREAKISATLGDTAGFRQAILRLTAKPISGDSKADIEATLLNGARRFRARGNVTEARAIDEWAAAFLDSSSVYKRLASDHVNMIITEYRKSGILYDLGRLKEARTSLEHLDEMLSGDSALAPHLAAANDAFDFPLGILGSLAVIALRQGDSAAAGRYRRRILDSKSPIRATDKYVLARIAAIEGDHDAAIRLLSEACRADFIWLEWISIDPDFDGLRSNPSYKSLFVITQ